MAEPLHIVLNMKYTSISRSFIIYIKVREVHDAVMRDYKLERVSKWKKLHLEIYSQHVTLREYFLFVKNNKLRFHPEITQKYH